MPTLTQARPRKRSSQGPSIIETYDISADSKRRFSLRRTGSKFFSVVAFSDGSFKLEPRKLVPAEVTIDKVVSVPVPRGAQQLMARLGAALDQRRNSRR
jgi:hypothetical protein